MNNDSRLSHSACDHAKNPAARKLCRTGDAILRTVQKMDHLVVNGVHYSVRQVSALYTAPAEVRVSTYVNGSGWVEMAGWISADFFAKAMVEN